MVGIATVNFSNSPKMQNRAGLKYVLGYCAQEKKCRWNDRLLVSGVNCTPESVFTEMVNTKLLYGKDSNRYYYHMVQAFDLKDTLSPETAHEIALKLAERYKDYEILVCTHMDRPYIHSHFIINSVGFETGRKLHQCARDIDKIRKMSDAMCREYGLNICQPKPKSEQVKGIRAKEYHTAMRGGSWKFQLINVIDAAMKRSHTRDEFLDELHRRGYEVTWTQERKYITYTHPNGQKARDKSLHDDKYLKWRMEDEFRIRTAILDGRASQIESTGFEYSLAGREDRDGAGEQLGIADQPQQTDGGYAGGDARKAGYADHDTAVALGASTSDEPETGHGKGVSRSSGQDSLGDENRASELWETGWESERAACFGYELADEGMADATLGHEAGDEGLLHTPDISGSGGAGLADDLVKLAYAVENLSDPDAPVQDATTMKHHPKKKKKAPGQKQDDHEDGQQYGGMTM